MERLNISAGQHNNLKTVHEFRFSRHRNSWNKKTGPFWTPPDLVSGTIIFCLQPIKWLSVCAYSKIIFLISCKSRFSLGRTRTDKNCHIWQNMLSFWSITGLCLNKTSLHTSMYLLQISSQLF